MARPSRSSRIHNCNVLFDHGGVSQLWTFTGAEMRPGPSSELTSDAPLPPKVVGKGWSQLIRRRLNIAWTGDQPLFFQLVHLPTDDPTEVPAMLELQLERLSPLPVGQVVWSYEVLRQRPPNGLAVLVVIAERSALESMLSDLEARGFRADRIESPIVALISGTDFTRDGAHIFVFRTISTRFCLIGWVADGALRALNVVNLASDDRWVTQLLDEINRLSWVGELEGWASGAPPVHLVADDETIQEWRPDLEKALGAAVTGFVRPPDPVLAASSAARAASAKDSSNLLPSEYAARYQQEFTDRLWMGGLVALFGTYLVCVLIYLAVVQVQRFRYDRLMAEVEGIQGAYTNTLRLKAQAQVLQETVNLRYAALDCWLATVEAMPEELSLENLAFTGGRQMVISGSAPQDQDHRITEFWQALRRKQSGNTNLFKDVQLQPTSVRTVQGTPQIQWSFVCTLHRTEI